MENLNLDVDSYSDEDIMKLFSLKGDFSSEAARTSGKRLISQVNATKLNPEKKRSIDLFVSSCIQRLVSYANQGHTDPNQGTWAQKYNTMVAGTNHQIIEKPRVEAGKQGPMFRGEIGAGYLNPFAITTLNKGINIDSRFRKNYFTTSASDFMFHLPDPLRKVQSMTVSATDVPLSAYAISKKRGDNAFLISDETATITTATTGTSHVNGNPSFTHFSGITTLYAAWLVIMPDGLYELSWQAESQAQPLVVSVNNAIALSIPGILDKNTGIFYRDIAGYATSSLNPSVDISFLNDRISGRSILGYPTGHAVTTSSRLVQGFNVHFAIDQYGNRDLDNSLQMKLGWKLGYRMGNYIVAGNSSTTSTTSSNVALSEGVCLVSPPRYAFISIDDGQKASNNNYSVAFAESSLDQDIIARLNYAADVNSNGAYLLGSDIGLDNAMNRTRQYFGPVDIDKIRIRLLDEYGRILDLNHMDWSMTLSFVVLYE